MNKDAYTADRIEVSVSGTFKTVHSFFSSYRNLGKMALNAARSEGFFLGVDGSQLALNKTSFWKSEFEISQDGEILASAAPRGALKRAYDIQYQGNRIELKPGGSKLRSWTVRNSQGVALCEFLPRKGLKRGAQILIKAELQLPLLVLCYLLVIRRWQEETSAS